MNFLKTFNILLCAFMMSCTTSNSDIKKLSQQPTSELILKDINKNMVLIPSGTYIRGGKSDEAGADEFPNHKVKISAFYMDEAEVTNNQFKVFVDSTSYITVAERDINWEEMSKQLPMNTPKPPDSVLQAGSLVFTATKGPVDLRDYSQWWVWTIGANWKNPEGPKSHLNNRMDHPVVHIAWEDAQAYSQWIGKRLPSEAEWEWAAMGGIKASKYPWGDEPAEKSFDKANFWQGYFPFQNLEKDGFYASAPVKTFPPNGYGLYDMAGNVWEWCQDKYRFDAYKLDKNKGDIINPKGPNDFFDPTEPNVPKYVIRGGSFLCNDSYCSGYRVSRRMRSSKDSGFNHTGFRCVTSIK